MHLVSATPDLSRRTAAAPRLLRLPDVQAATGLKKSTIYLLMRRGDFPASVQVTPRCVAWSEAAVLAWVQDRIQQSAGLVQGVAS